MATSTGCFKKLPVAGSYWFFPWCRIHIKILMLQFASYNQSLHTCPPTPWNTSQHQWLPGHCNCAAWAVPTVSTPPSPQLQMSHWLQEKALPTANMPATLAPQGWNIKALAKQGQQHGMLPLQTFMGGLTKVIFVQLRFHGMAKQFLHMLCLVIQCLLLER
jgi:hypothetical protein